ncbi:MAG: ArsR/SmtB family transcription factor [Candidatus Heimdallarchaeaceae archaeon]
MDEIDEMLDIEDLFEVLSNSTRRKILQLLSSEALYPFQISKILEISPRIVGKYITELEELGLITTVEKKSDKGPSRKYAQLNKSFSIMIDVSPNNFTWKIIPISEVFESKDEIPKKEKKVTREIFREIEQIKESIQNQLKKIIEIDNKRQKFVSDINECFKRFNNLLESIIDEYSDRVYVRTLFKEMINTKEKWISLSHLSNVLREWRGDIKDRLITLAEETGLIKYKQDGAEYWFTL